ncbi:MAG: DUF2007 domain-containing protein [Melioribacteraceae bacterium]|nr:DUF2007 domain-containing protein [Melioribacteraceae bacterium]
MNTCFIHSEKEALSICRGCGKTFCELCLDEGKEYYFCKNSECQELLKKELPSYKVSESVICTKCESELELSEEERIFGKIHCPECDAMIDYTEVPPKLLDREHYTEILSSLNQGDIALIKSILEDGKVDYYILGELFLSIRPLLEPVRVFVNENHVEKAKMLLENFDLNIFGISTK